MKNLKNMNKKINNYLVENGFDVKACIGMFFCYDYIENEIVYSLVTVQDGAEKLMSVAKGINNNLDTNDFILAFFHEVGHYMTFDELEDDDWVGYSTVSGDEYYTHPIEYSATEWATNYIVENKEKVDNLWRSILEDIVSYYEELAKRG